MSEVITCVYRSPIQECPNCGNTEIMKCTFTGDEVVEGYVTWYCGVCLLPKFPNETRLVLFNV